MNKLKKVGLTALAGSLAAFSANAAEMSVSGATLVTYTTEHSTETTGNPLGMKTNLAFTAAGEVNGYNVSYYQASKDQFAGTSSSSLTLDMGDMGSLIVDQGFVSATGLGTIDDKTPTAAEEIWDGITFSGQPGTGASGSVLSYKNTFSGVTGLVAMRKGSGGHINDGVSSGTGGGAWDVVLTADGEALGMDGVSLGAGYGKADPALITSAEDKHITAFVNYSTGPLSFGVQIAQVDIGLVTTADTEARSWGVAFNVNDNLSVSYGSRDVEFNTGGTIVDEETNGVAIAYTMGSIKIAGNRNEQTNAGGTSGTDDAMTEVALSFAF